MAIMMRAAVGGLITVTARIDKAHRLQARCGLYIHALQWTDRLQYWLG